MWLKNDILRVFFDERKGGMPVRDSFGFINAVAVEIVYALTLVYPRRTQCKN